MGTAARTSKSIEASERPESPFRVLFDRAWGRIGKSKILTGWEIIVWSVLAWRVGHDYYGYYREESVDSIVPILWIFILGLSPILIGVWVYQVHAARSTLDDNIRILPITPQTFIGARMLAVGWMWLRVFGPILLLVIHLFCLYRVADPLYDRMALMAATHLSLIIPFLNDFRLHEVSADVRLIAILFFITQFIGWLTLPITWAFYWGTRISRNVFFFFVGYFLYLPVLGGLYYLHQYPENNYQEWYTGLDLYPGAVPLIGLFGILISFYLFTRTCHLVGRRP